MPTRARSRGAFAAPRACRRCSIGAPSKRVRRASAPRAPDRSASFVFAWRAPLVARNHPIVDELESVSAGDAWKPHTLRSLHSVPKAANNMRLAVKTASLDDTRMAAKRTERASDALVRLGMRGATAALGVSSGVDPGGGF